MIRHLLRYQGFEVYEYDFTLDAPAKRDHTSDFIDFGVRLVAAKRKSRRRGIWGILDFRSSRVIPKFERKSLLLTLKFLYPE